MDAVVLCGGFAKRMWPLTRDTPKTLLQVMGRPVMEHIMEKLEGMDEIERIFISINRRFRDQFISWFMDYPTEKHVELVVEPSLSEGEKLGSIGAWEFLIREKKLGGDLLSVSGDNFFDFDLKSFLEFQKRVGGTAVGIYDVMDVEVARKKLGIVELDSNNKIVGFEEKPENPKGTLASTGIYMFPGEVLKLVLKYLEEGNSPDKAGMFLKWLYKIKPVYGFIFQGEWVDIGNMETYQRLQKQSDSEA